MPKRLTRSLLVLALLAGAPAIEAATITFDGFATGGFAGGVEGGYTISAANTMVWDAIYGFPSLSVGSGAPSTLGSVTVTGGVPFSFVSLDLVNPNFSGSLGPVVVRGYLSSTLVATDTLPVPVLLATPTTSIASALAGQTIDTLVVEYTSDTSKTPLVDNIIVAEIPEPSTGALAVIGLVAAAAARRKRRDGRAQTEPLSV